MVSKSLWGLHGRAAAFAFKTEKLANNNQFNYSQNIYSRIGFVIRTQSEEKWFFFFACCTVCFHFPDGLSSLSPDLVCVVLHSPVICVGLRTALCRCIHLYISQRSALSLSHLVLHVLSLLLLRGLFAVPLARAQRRHHISIYSLIWTFVIVLRPKNSLYTADPPVYINRVAGFFSMWPCVHRCRQYNYLPPDPLSLLLLQQVLRPLRPCTGKCQRPGDGISKMMSIFTCSLRPLHQERKERIRSLQMPPHHLSLTRRIVGRWASTLSNEERSGVLTFKKPTV